MIFNFANSLLRERRILILILISAGKLVIKSFIVTLVVHETILFYFSALIEYKEWICTKLCNTSKVLLHCISNMTFNVTNHIIPTVHKVNVIHSITTFNAAYSNGTNACSKSGQYPRTYKECFHTLLLCLAALIIIHNFIVLYLYRKERQLRSVTNLLLCNLACSDIFTGLVMIPLIIWTFLTNDRITRAIIGLSSIVAADIATIAQVFSLMTVAMERYVSLCHPFIYTRLSLKKKVIGIVFSIWIFSLTFSLTQVSYYYPLLSPAAPKCLKRADNRRMLEDPQNIYYFTLFSVCFLVPAVIMLYALLTMFVTIHKITKREIMIKDRDRRRRQLRVVTVFSVMYVCLLLCWSPLIAVRMLKLTDYRTYNNLKEWMLQLFVLLRCLTSFTNPLIYVWWKTDFRVAIFKRKLFRTIMRVPSFSSERSARRRGSSLKSGETLELNDVFKE